MFFFLITAISMIVGCVAFPFGWNSNDFRKICGPESNRFELGLCGIRWAYPLAIIGMCAYSLSNHWFNDLSFLNILNFSIGCIDACILATLAFILATRHVRLQPEPMYQNSMFKGKASIAFIILSKYERIAMLQVKSIMPISRMRSAWLVHGNHWICSRFYW